MDNRLYMAEQLNRLLDEVAGKDFFTIYDDGSMETVVHTGGIIEGFELKIEFPKGNVLITTTSYLGVVNNSLERVNALIDSLNEIINYGRFAIRSSRICFTTRCGYGYLASQENPFDILFLGCETFNAYSETLLKTLAGASFVYMPMN